MINLTLLFALLMAFSSSVSSQERKQKILEPEIFKKAKTKIERPLELRDPFKRKLIKTTVVKKNRTGKIREGVFSNLPSIDNAPLGTVRIVGILLGKERRAIAKLAEGQNLSKESYILKEGMTLGENNAEIKAILPGGVVLVEKIRNVYDQDEYLETVLPVMSRF